MKIFKGEKYDWHSTNDTPMREGGNSLIYIVNKENDPSQDYALKIFQDNKKLKSNRKERFKKEINIAKKLSKLDGFIEFLDNGFKKEIPFYVMPYYDNGNLYEYILSERYPDDLIPKLNLFIHILERVKKAHDIPIALRDIKPQNIFLTKDNTPIIGDYGLSIEIKNSVDRITKTQERVGSQGYIAPEAIQKMDSLNFLPVDIWSLGRTFWAMLAKKHPPNNFTSLGSNRTHIENYINHEYSSYIQSILTSCTQQDPQLRPDINELIAQSKEVRNYILEIQEADTEISNDISQYLERLEYRVTNSSVTINAKREQSEINIKIKELDGAVDLLKKEIKDNYLTLINNKIKEVGKCTLGDFDNFSPKVRNASFNVSPNKKQHRRITLRFDPNDKISSTHQIGWIWLRFIFGLTDEKKFYWAVQVKERYPTSKKKKEKFIEKIETKSLINLVKNKTGQLDEFLKDYFFDRIESHL